MLLTLEVLLKLLAAGGTGGLAHLVGNPGVTVATDAEDLWDAVVTSVRADQALAAILETTKEK